MSMARDTLAGADTAKALTMDEARRIASNITKLPGLLRSDERVGTGFSRRRRLVGPVAGGLLLKRSLYQSARAQMASVARKHSVEQSVEINSAVASEGEDTLAQRLAALRPAPCRGMVRGLRSLLASDLVHQGR